MLNKDVYNHQSVSKVLGPVAANADNTPAAIDLQGFRAALIQLDIGIGGITFDATNKIEFTVTHSDDDSTYANVTTDDIEGVASITDGIIKALTAAHAAAACYMFGYVGGKRYLKVLANFSGTHGSATPLAINVIRMHPLQVPHVS